MTWHRVDSEQPTPFESAFAGARNGRSRVRSRPQYAKMTFQIGSASATRIERRSRVVPTRLGWVVTRA